jgi:hypothetical protein
MVLQVDIIEPAAAAGAEGVVGIEYFPRANNYEKDMVDPPFDPLVGAKFFPMQQLDSQSRL